MSIGTRIKQRREQLGITQTELANMLGVTKGAIGNYETDRGSPKASMLYKLFDVLKCDANYIFQDETRHNNGISPAEVDHIKRYRALDRHGKQAVDALMSIEAERIVGEAPRRRKVIPLFGASFAAGSPEPDFGNMWSEYETDTDADFAIKINGESMEPYLHDGEIALGVKREPNTGEVGAFILDGGFLVKQFCDDSEGNVYLFSLNRAHKDIQVGKEQTLMCIGTILTDRRPLPREINI